MKSKSIKPATGHTELDDVRKQVNQFLDAYFQQRIDQAALMSKSYQQLWETMAKLHSAGGKRLRPYMVVLGYEAFGGKDTTSVLPVAAAWELLHFCMLIHDDIIDNDIVRYGVLNIAGSYSSYYDHLGLAPARRDHLASSAALLAGDLAQAAAYDVVSSSQLTNEQKLTAQSYLTAATFAVAGGELLDTESSIYPIDSVDPLAIARYKTASYSFVGPLCGGASLAGASTTQLAQIESFGMALGCAFQLIDDMLGVFGDSNTTGKSTIGDIREGKPTFMMQRAFQLASPRDRETLRQLVGKATISENEAAQVRDILSHSGARAAAETQIEAYITDCRDIVAALDTPDSHKEGLTHLISLTTKRIK